MDENLHSLKKLKNDIETAQRISFLLPEDMRIQIKNLQKQLEEIEKSTTLFNNYKRAKNGGVRQNRQKDQATSCKKACLSGAARARSKRTEKRSTESF